MKSNIFVIFYYQKGKNAVQARKKLSDVYGKDVLTERHTIKALIDANRRITTREIAERLNLSNSIVHDHLKRLGLLSKLDIWVPHVIMERNLCRCVNVCDLLLKRQEIVHFCSISSLETINGLSTMILNARKHGAKRMNRLTALRKPIFT
jgi:hypothetical protein